jgi:prephenate dehydratase
VQVVPPHRDILQFSLSESNRPEANPLPQQPPSPPLRIAIQGDPGSNSHLAALELLGPIDILPCTHSLDVIESLLHQTAGAAVLPIENTLHGAVAEHYDLLLAHPVRIDRESLLHVHHNLIAAPGVALAGLRNVLSHPVALAQCKHFLRAHPNFRATPFYDTAGAVRHIIAEHLLDTAAIAPALAATTYNAHILAPNIEDHPENYTRFHLLRRIADPPLPTPTPAATPNKLSVAFRLEHRPGTLVAALRQLADAGVDLTRIESRPVPGQPWQYVFFAEFRFDTSTQAETALHGLSLESSMVKELGRYAAAGPLTP